MWISISLSKSLSSLSFYINYVICEFWLYVFDWCFGAAFYINYVICESKGQLPSISYIGQVLYKLCDMWIINQHNQQLYVIQFYINYVICESLLLEEHPVTLIQFYINYVICEWGWLKFYKMS